MVSRRTDRRTAARHDLAAELGRAIIREPAWQTCRRCRVVFRASVYWPVCFSCYLEQNPTKT